MKTVTGSDNPWNRQFVMAGIRADMTRASCRSDSAVTSHISGHISRTPCNSDHHGMTS